METTRAEDAPSLDGSSDLPVGLDLVRRALALIDAKTTDMAPDVLHVPLSYYRDPDLHAAERELCRRTPMALALTVQVPQPHDYVVREVLGTSVLISRGADGVVRAFENYCRHRGGKPAEGCGTAQRFTCPYHAWSYDSAGRLGLACPARRASKGSIVTATASSSCRRKSATVWSGSFSKLGSPSTSLRTSARSITSWAVGACRRASI